MKRWPLRLAAWASRRIPARGRALLYRLGPLTRLARRLLNQAAPAGLNEVRIAAGLLEGHRFKLDLQVEKDLWLGTYELDLQERLPSWIEPGDVVYDVGANIGYLTVGFAHLIGRSGLVHAFEPLPMNVERLQRAVADNDLERQVKIIAAAVGSETGSATFLTHPSGGMGKLAGSYGRQTRYAEEIEVRVLSLDSYVYEEGNPAPDWIKIDVEGGEGAVLRGAGRLLQQKRPSLLMEIHGPKAAREVWDFLSEEGYEIFTVDHPQQTMNDPAALGWKAYVVARSMETYQAEFGG